MFRARWHTETAGWPFTKCAGFSVRCLFSSLFLPAPCPRWAGCSHMAVCAYQVVEGAVHPEVPLNSGLHRQRAGLAVSAPGRLRLWAARAAELAGVALLEAGGTCPPLPQTWRGLPEPALASTSFSVMFSALPHSCRAIDAASVLATLVCVQSPVLWSSFKDVSGFQLHF